MSLNKPPFSAVDMFVSGYFVAWLLSLNKRCSLLKNSIAELYVEENIGKLTHRLKYCANPNSLSP